MIAFDPAAGRARTFLGHVNQAIIARAGARRQGHEASVPGARAPVSLGGDPVCLEAITEGRGADLDVTERGELVAMWVKDPVTAAGYKTARRSLPRLLSVLDQQDPRLTAARFLADAMERVGAVKGAKLEGQDGAGGGANDGGATTRIKHAARLRLIEACANRWPVTRTGAITRAAPRALMAPRKRSGKRQPIHAFDALCAICVECLPLDEILRRHGWEARSRYRTRLAVEALASLDDVADGLGLGRWVPSQDA